MKAVLIAGGLGTRLAPLTEKVPKPLLPLSDGKPMLEHQILFLKKQGITDIIICIGYLGEKIVDYFGNGLKWGVNITYSKEHEPLGTGGALYLARKLIGKGIFLMAYADLVIDMDVKKFLAFHTHKKALVSQCVHPSDHPHDSDMLKLDSHDRVIAYLGKPKKGDQFENIGNAGLYMMDSRIFEYEDAWNGASPKRALDKDVLPFILAQGGAIYAYRTNELIKDVGTHDRYVKK